MGETPYPRLVLKPGREKAVRNRHHWVFSGAVRSVPDCENGSVVAVFASDGALLGHAILNRRCSIIARMISFGSGEPIPILRRSFERALELRRDLLEPATDAYRIVHAEADGVPGLVVDRYAGFCVVQIGTLGMDRLRDVVLGWIRELCQPDGVYERSDSPARREEGLKPRKGWIFGREEESVEIREEDCRFRVDFAGGQKTGFYLDQRANRRRVRRFAAGRRVLDCFSYTGGFAVSALGGGARAVTLVDSSRAALETAKVNVELNGSRADAAEYVASDAFEFLQGNAGEHDFVILDPPAFARQKKDVAAASRAYEAINRAAIAKLPSGGLLLSCSCSYHMDAVLFRKVIFRASLKAGREVSILQGHAAGIDHPVNVFHPETDYLKSLLLVVR